MDSAGAGGMRRDALHNHDLIIEAARQVFAEEGVDASMSGIARRAGVGVATIFRHFPGRDELVTAVFAAPLEECARGTAAALSEPDAWTGLRAYILQLGRTQAQDRGLAAVIISWFARTHDELSIGDQSCHDLDELIDRAKACGALRADFSRDDIVLLLRANSGVLADQDADWQRFLTRALEGYRAA